MRDRRGDPALLGPIPFWQGMGIDGAVVYITHGSGGLKRRRDVGMGKRDKAQVVFTTSRPTRHGRFVWPLSGS
ncbi:MAG: hypothetical protein D6E12_07615 [Desulfovibrio sp.]|nr:MAG: hypothetical protein D6E12_07615 [Desulfovibrio sp.]